MDKEESTREITKYFEMDENKNTTYQILLDAKKSMFSAIMPII